MTENGYEKLFHFPTFKEFIKSITSEIGYDGGIGNDPYYNQVSLHLKASATILSDVNNFEKGCCDLFTPP